MAWYLSEVVTELPLLDQALRLYEDKEAEDTDVFYKRYADYLRNSYINTDHINHDSIPEEYEQNEYKWLAFDVHQLLRKFRLINIQSGENEIKGYYELTELG